MSSNPRKMPPVLREVSAGRLLFDKSSIHINFSQHGGRVIRHSHMSPVARGNDGKGNDVENFFVVFLVVIPDNLPILHCEVVLVVLVIRMASNCVEQFVATPGIKHIIKNWRDAPL